MAIGIGHLPGLGALLEALGTTNVLLEGVLKELQRTNDDALKGIAAELRAHRDVLESIRGVPAA